MHAAVARGDVDSAELHGVADAYEPPERPDLAFDTALTDLAESVDEVVALLHERGVLAGRM